jgi:hypothetical protein
VKKTVILKSEIQRKTAINYLMDVPLSPLHEITIKLHKADRSACQNRLYWLWMTEIGKQTGELKEDVHERYKEKTLVHIYERDNEGFAEMIESVRKVYHLGEKKLAKVMQREILKLTSTRDANVDQFREYLNDIEIDCAHNNLSLTHPDDLYSYAMKEKKQSNDQSPKT